MTENDRPALEIEITEEMLEAGIRAACLFRPTEDDFSLMLPEIYRAMRRHEQRRRYAQ